MQPGETVEDYYYTEVTCAISHGNHVIDTCVYAPNTKFCNGHVNAPQTPEEWQRDRNRCILARNETAMALLVAYRARQR